MGNKERKNKQPLSNLFSKLSRFKKLIKNITQILDRPYILVALNFRGRKALKMFKINISTDE